jgi:hypothetical protein
LNVEIKLPKLIAEEQNPDHLIDDLTEDQNQTKQNPKDFDSPGQREDATKEYARVGGYVQVKSDAFTGNNSKFNG